MTPDVTPSPSRPPAGAKADALAAAGAIAAAPMTDRLLDLYRRAARLELADSQGRRWRGLTDYEAAAYLGVERTTINAARNTLLKRGLVAKERRRRCRYRPSNQDVWAWGLAEG